MKKNNNKQDFSLDKYLILSGLIGPLIFFLIIYFLLPVFYPGYSIQRDYISELGAVDSPIKVIANVFGFSLFGIFIMIFALGVYRQRELNNLRKISAIFIFLAGISMFLVGIFACDAGCENFSLRGDLHIKTSDTFIFPVLAAGYIVLAVSLIKNKRLLWLIAPIAILGLPTLYLSYANINLMKDYPGILQRIRIGLPFLLMMIISFGLYRFNKE